IGRGGKKPRKDLTTWKDVKPYMSFFYTPYFSVDRTPLARFPEEDVTAVCTRFLESWDPADEMGAWFDKIKGIADALGYASDMKAYKADPTAFKGSVADVSMFLRVAVTGRENAPDLYTVMQILGDNETRARIQALMNV
ncbi:MAG: glutamate--tRNA ligase, partial [Clostridia bacterium]|nr:glutamate--tRNA ligase [Clostridia bacterium]